MTKNIVTGATGFLGKELSKRLISLGEEVIGIGRNEDKGRELEKEGIKFLPLDLSKKQLVLNLFPKGDYVFHCSALSSEWGRFSDFYKSNVESTKNVIGACFKNKSNRLIYVSTPSVYLDKHNRLNINEENSFTKKPLNYYTSTKIEAEKYIDIASKNGLEVVTIRPRGIIGIGDKKLIPNIIESNIHQGVPFINNGDSLIDLTPVENVVDSLILARDNGVSGEHYNISNGEHRAFSELVNTFFEMSKLKLNVIEMTFNNAYNLARAIEIYAKIFQLEKLPLTRYTVCLIGRSQTFDITKARKDLGYEPKKKIDNTLEEIANGYR